jgi:hypothetical protein
MLGCGIVPHRRSAATAHEIVGSCILSSPKQSLDAPDQEMSASKRFDKS